MANIRGIQGMTVDELNRELKNGGKFVVFDVCISVIIITSRSKSDIFFVRAEKSTRTHYMNIISTLTTLLLGWWGIPWGPIYTVAALVNNFKGGTDVTQEVINSLNK